MKHAFSKFRLSVLVIPALVVTALGILITLFSIQSSNIIMTVRAFFDDNFSWYYLTFGITVFVILLCLAFSKIGKIKLGKETDKPMKVSTYCILLFTSTMAADLIFYALHDWTYYYNTEYLTNIASSQADKILWSSSYSFFHFSFIPFAIYLLLAVIYAFMFFTRKHEYAQSMGAMCLPLFNKIRNKRIVSSLKTGVDITSIIGLLLGTSTTFSIATPLMTAIICKIFNLPNTTVISIIILIIIAIIYATAVLVGHNGITLVAKLSVIFCAAVMSLLFVIGNPVYLLEYGIQGFGNMLENFIGMSTFTDPARLNGNFVQNFTQFYWAYWIAWCVATPFFIAKASKGRTIKQVIIQGMLSEVAGVFTIFTIFGGFTTHAFTSGSFDFVGLIESGASISTCIVELISSKGQISYVLFALLFMAMVGLYASTFDALADVVSNASYKQLSINDNSSKSVRLYWSIVFIVFPIALLFLNSTTQILQTLSIIGAVLISFIYICIVISFFIELRKHNAGIGGKDENN